jgi:plastocyanin
MKKSLTIFGLFVLLALGFLLTQGDRRNVNSLPSSDDMPGAMDTVIRMTPAGFEPSKITVPLGTTVAFINEDERDRWPASNIHPTHGIYPEFDPLEGIPPGESWSFTFDKPGIWRMHDHLYPQFTGAITVEE